MKPRRDHHTVISLKPIQFCTIQYLNQAEVSQQGRRLKQLESEAHNAGCHYRQGLITLATIRPHSNAGDSQN